MAAHGIKIYGYRWLVLAVFMLVVMFNQIAWITFAPITSEAMAFYNQSDLMIGLLSMVFMIVYIAVVLPAAWLIDTKGFRIAVGFGALLTALGALGRGLFARDFTLVFIFQVVIAIGQPFVVGAITKLAARWFPHDERATAAGLGTLAVYLGVLCGMFFTPSLRSGLGMEGLLVFWGLAAAVSAVLFIVLSREHPPTKPGPEGSESRTLVFTGLKKMLNDPAFIILLVIFFFGLGMFNGISTWIEQILKPRGFTSDQAGVTGGLILTGGIIGAFILPLVSDKLRRRKPFIVLSLAGLIPGLIGLILAESYWLLLASGFAFGFFLLSSGPIGFQYGAEITHPAPEGTSNSLLILMGQVSGIIFIFLMDALKNPDGSMTVPLWGMMGLMVIAIVLAFFLRESPIHAPKK
jgi:MFS family permease